MENILAEIEQWRDDHWNQIIEDIDSLVKIASVEDLENASEGAPYGPGPRQALDQALAIASRMGLDAHDCEGHIGYADLIGGDSQIGIIGHVDVVPAGPGWAVEPYAVTRREGYLMGRGVIDDKGPLMVALHAVKFWADRYRAQGAVPPHTVRVLFGANEETNMKDAAYYRSRYDDPAFLFTPDSQFPVGYGESGICSGTLESGLLEDGAIVQIEGGQAVNAVPGFATAVVRADASALPARPNVEVSSAGNGLARIEAQGVSAHASTPELGVNAIGVLVGYLLDAGVGTEDERAFLALNQELLASIDGSYAGVACRDDHFGPLSMVGGVISLDGNRMRQSFDFRYPTTITSEEISRLMNEAVRAAGLDATYTMEHDKTPFLMDPDSPAVRALLDAYCDVTGEEAKGMTSKGGTYARCFTTGVSFGLEKPWVASPDWVGSMHGPNEGVSEALLKQAFAVYAVALGNLMQIDLE